MAEFIISKSYTSFILLKKSSRMQKLIFIFFTITRIHGIAIPVIRNVSFISASPKNSTVLVNVTCLQCFCTIQASNPMAFNCHTDNQTCEVFYSYPTTYRLESKTNSDFYFLRSIFPETSDCCMSNFTQLKQKLLNARVTSILTPKPRCLVIDNHGYLVTVEHGGSYIRRFNRINLSLIDETSFSGLQMEILVYYSDAYYISLSNNKVLVIDSNRLSMIGYIDVNNAAEPRDIMFLNGGQLMVLASHGNDKIFFYNQTGGNRTQYSQMHKLSTNFQKPHGLGFINDTYFHVTSMDNAGIYSVSMNTTGHWDLYTFATNPFSSVYGSHVTIDQCSRRWLSHQATPTFSVWFDDGSLVDSVDIQLISTFDAVIDENYVIYLSGSSPDAIYRVDPNITCF